MQMPNNTAFVMQTLTANTKKRFSMNFCIYRKFGYQLTCFRLPSIAGTWPWQPNAQDDALTSLPYASWQAANTSINHLKHHGLTSQSSPEYITELCASASSQPGHWSLCSAAHGNLAAHGSFCTLMRVRRAFSCIGPSYCTSLLLTIRYTAQHATQEVESV